YATFGHNHIVALLLLVLPLSWREFLLAKQEKSRQAAWLSGAGVALISLVLLMSFGRMALFLAVWQLLVLWFFGQKIPRVKALKIPLLIVATVFTVVLGAKMFFSYQTAHNPKFSCPFPGWMKQKICKPFNGELRPLYLVQAWK